MYGTATPDPDAARTGAMAPPATARAGVAAAGQAKPGAVAYGAATASDVAWAVPGTGKEASADLLPVSCSWACPTPRHRLAARPEAC